jgi:CRISPR-associated protein Cmr2
MSDKKQYFHFTIGPVQGFVAQARRTRDFWAGSFILSWLATVAMKAVTMQEGDDAIKFPLPDERFMKAVESGSPSIKQGNVPNRFKAEVSKAFKPELVEQSVRTAWKGLADAVWKKDLKDFSLNTDKTRKIWERQIEGFWDIQWAIINDESESSTLDKLKNWRTHLPAPEAGVKCMMMDGLQELSGAERPGRKEQDPEGPYSFWNKLREGKEVDLREKEYLCAVAYVKRRFVHVFKSVKIDMGNWNAHGWTISRDVPSVDYMAAAPWLAQLLIKANKDAELNRLMWSFHNMAVKLTRDSSEIPTLGYPEWQSNILCVREADAHKKWQALDGRVFFDSMLENPRLWDKGLNGTKAEDAQALLKQLKILRKKAELEPVSPFYAILLMDGDDLGKQMSDIDKQPYITKGLSDFTKQVETIVCEHSGFLVYAGGDDVLAILPLEYAMDCAVELRTTYDAVFTAINATAQAEKQVWIQTSISAAIEYAHIKTPLGKVLGDSHKLLDNIAKDQHGRDSIACRVWKPGGLQMEWGMPWDKALNADNRVILDVIADQFRNQQCFTESTESNSESGEFASKFFFRIRERFELLTPPPSDDKSDKKPEGQRPIPEELVTFDVKGKGLENAVSLMAMEYLNSGIAKANGINIMSEAKEKVRPLLKQCRHVVRKVIPNDGTSKTKPAITYSIDEDYVEKPNAKKYGFKADAALLVRFLAHKGIER